MSQLPVIDSEFEAPSGFGSNPNDWTTYLAHQDRGQNPKTAQEEEKKPMQVIGTPFK